MTQLLHIRHVERKKNNTKIINKAENQRLTCSLPVQTQCVQEGRQAFHDEENGHRERGEGEKDDREEDEAQQALAAEAQSHHHGPKHLGQL